MYLHSVVQRFNMPSLIVHFLSRHTLHFCHPGRLNLYGSQWQPGSDAKCCWRNGCVNGNGSYVRRIFISGGRRPLPGRARVYQIGDATRVARPDPHTDHTRRAQVSYDSSARRGAGDCAATPWVGDPGSGALREGGRGAARRGLGVCTNANRGRREWGGEGSCTSRAPPHHAERRAHLYLAFCASDILRHSAPIVLPTCERGAV